MTTEQPDWFRKAVAAPYDEGSVAVKGTDVHYLEWGQRGRPGLVFVHGGAAHAHWWSYLAPFFAERWHAVALDLSGHGDSGRRSDYSHELWAHEVLSVAEDARFPGPPVVVGHSLGGVVTIETAASHGELIAGAVVVDSPVRGPDHESREGASGTSPVRTPGVYEDKQTAVDHFRLIPEQPVTNQFILDYIANHSLIETDAGRTEPSGAEYKRRIHEALAGVDEALAFVSLRDPVYTEQGERVRIEAERLASFGAERQRVTLVVGPGSDGGWRILEEVSSGWP